MFLRKISCGRLTPDGAHQILVAAGCRTLCTPIITPGPDTLTAPSSSNSGVSGRAAGG